MHESSEFRREAESGGSPEACIAQLRAEVARLRVDAEELRWARHAADAVEEAVFRVDATGRFLDVNRSACRMYGRTRDELLALRVPDIDTSPVPDFALFMARLRRDGGAVFESTNRRADGTTFPVRVEARLIEFDGVAQCVGVVHDLTTERRHAQLVREIARGISTTSGKTFFLTLLQHLAAALGADHAFVAELVAGQPGRARTIALLVDRAEQPNLEYDLAGTPCAEVVEGCMRCYAGGLQQLFPDDRLAVELGAVGYAGMPLFHSDGTALGLLVVVTRQPIADLPQVEALLPIFAVRAAVELERLQAEQARRQSEVLLRNVLDHTKAVVFVKRADGRYLLVNREYEQVVGVTEEQIRDRTDHDQLPAWVAGRMRENDLQVLHRREAMQFEEYVPLPTGEMRTYLSIKVPLLDENGEAWAVCGIATDITERKNLELQLRQVQRLESVGLLAGGVAHDFNNLLTAIQGYTDMAVRSVGEAHPARALLTEVQGATRRAAGLTRQLLAFARRQEVTPRSVGLVRAVEDVCSLMRPLVGARIRIESTLPAGLWAAHADPGQLEQVLVNLVVNARDAMPEGGSITFEAANVTYDEAGLPAGSGLAAGEYVRLSVRDTGTGMPPETLSRIFEPFFTTKGVGKGTGLGLAICHGILRQCGGHIEAASEPGRGTEFTLLMPRSGEPVAEAVVAPRTALAPGRGRLLIVEDEPSVRSLAVRALQEAGYQVQEAACGEDALALVNGGALAADLLLTDVVMPGLSGPELADRLRSRRPDLKVLFMTGYAEDSLRERLKSSGATVLEKPFPPSALTVAVRDALAARG